MKPTIDFILFLNHKKYTVQISPFTYLLNPSKKIKTFSKTYGWLCFVLKIEDSE